MFDILNGRYKKGWIRIDQLHKYVGLGVITSDEFISICGMAYIE